MQSYSNHANMHSYYSSCAFMHNFTHIDVGIFLLKKCKISYFSILQDFTHTDGDALITTRWEMKSCMSRVFTFFGKLTCEAYMSVSQRGICSAY